MIILKFKVRINDEIINCDGPISLMDLNKNKDYEYICANVNNRIRELSFIIDRECDIEFLNLTNQEAMRIYEASIRYLMCMAVYNVLPNKDIEFKNSISRSILCQFKDSKIKVDNQIVNLINEEMKRLVELDLPIKRVSLSKASASDYYEKMGFINKLEVLKYRPDENVNLYKCGNYMSHFFE